MHNIYIQMFILHSFTLLLSHYFIFIFIFYIYRRPGILVLINDIDWELLVNVKIIVSYIYIYI